MNWFKDRDFAEVKREVQNEPSEILAHIPDPKQLERVVEVHNQHINAWQAAYTNLLEEYNKSVNALVDRYDEASDEINDLRTEVNKYKEALEAIRDSQEPWEPQRVIANAALGGFA